MPSDLESWQAAVEKHTKRAMSMSEVFDYVNTLDEALPPLLEIARLTRRMWPFRGADNDPLSTQDMDKLAALLRKHTEVREDE